MKKLYTLLFASLLAWSAEAQIFDWAIATGGPGEDESQSIDVDEFGNVLVTGRFVGTVDFDPSASTFNLTSAGDRDVFIQKIDQNGSLIWAKAIGGTARDDSYSIAADSAGNVFVSGRFEATVDFDPGIGTFNLTSSGSRDLFIVKLSSTGAFLWAKTMGGTQSDRASSVTADQQGNVLISGYFGGTVDFDPSAASFNLTSLGNEDVFILKLDAGGNLIWAKALGGTSDDEALESSIDKLGNLYITGFFEGIVDFDPGSGTLNLSANGGVDAFVLKLDVAGDFVWAKAMGGQTDDESQSIIVAESGNIYVTGYFEGTVDFDPSAAVLNLSSNGLADAFIQKLDPNGNLIWAKSMGGLGAEEGRSVSADSSGNVYITGYFEAAVDFDPGAGNFNLTSGGQTDAFILKLDLNGDFEWAAQLEGTSFVSGNSIANDAHGNVFTTGNFASTVDFDPSAGNFNLSSAGISDVFIQKLSQCFPTSGISTVTACDSYTWTDGNTYFASNNTAADTLINARGCDSIVTLNLTINNVSDLSTSVNGLTITSNNTNASYQWLNCDNNFSPLIGETSADFTASMNGNYAVELSENTCLDTSECVSISIVGSVENDSEKPHLFYPQPTEELVSIELRQDENVSIRVHDINARLVFSIENISTELYQFRLLTKPGVYFLSVEAQGEIRTYKLIKI